jgi:cysteine desulfurase/selenocysteine lyase
VDVQALGCDFYAFSGHKVFGPTGIGVLYGRRSLLEEMPPFQTGGGMIRTVTFETTEYADPPHRFEAGTPHIAGAVGLAEAVEYVRSVGADRIQAHERDLTAYGTATLSRVPGVRLIGDPRERAGIVSFVLEGVHAHDVASVLDRSGVAVRAGHHCCQPLMARLGLPATVRASFACYNVRADIDALAEGLNEVRRLFR